MSDSYLPDFEDDEPEGTEEKIPGDPGDDRQVEEPADRNTGDAPQESIPPAGNPVPGDLTRAARHQQKRSEREREHRPGNGNGDGKHAPEPPDIEYNPFEGFGVGEFMNPEEDGLPDLGGEWLEGAALPEDLAIDGDLTNGDHTIGDFEDLFDGPENTPGPSHSRRPDNTAGRDFIQRAVLRVYQRSSRAGGRQFAAGQAAGGTAGRGAIRLPFVERRINPRLCSAGMLEEIELMRALVNAAAQAQSEDEAAAYAAAMVPGAVRLAPGFTRGLWPAVPALIAGVDALARLFFTAAAYGGQAEPGQWMALIPAILVETVASLARICAQGEPAASQAPAVLAQQVAAVLNTANPADRGGGRNPSSGAKRRGGG